MNILATAVAHVSKVYPEQSIRIINYKTALVNGLDYKRGAEVLTIANVQPLGGQATKEAGAALDSTPSFRFWVLGDDVKLVSAVLHDGFSNAVILYNEATYKVFYKEDWSLNGWVIIDAAMQSPGVSKEARDARQNPIRFPS